MLSPSVVPHKVLLVEDEQSIRRLYEQKLRLENFEVFTAANGSEGFKAAKEHSPNIILLDLRMPGMSGDEMLAKLREQEWGAVIRIIVLTNLSRDEAPVSLRFLGVDRYIVKAHYTPSQVVSVVREVLDLR